MSPSGPTRRRLRFSQHAREKSCGTLNSTLGLTLGVQRRCDVSAEKSIRCECTVARSSYLAVPLLPRRGSMLRPARSTPGIGGEAHHRNNSRGRVQFGTLLKQLAADDRGQDLVEYGLLAAIIAV